MVLDDLCVVSHGRPRLGFGRRESVKLLHSGADERLHRVKRQAGGSKHLIGKRPHVIGEVARENRCHMQFETLLAIGFNHMRRKQTAERQQIIERSLIVGLGKEMHVVQGHNQIARERLHGPQHATTGTPPVKQVYRFAARGVNPQGAVIGHSSDHIGNHIISHSDDIDIGILNETMQVIGG